MHMAWFRAGTGGAIGKLIALLLLGKKPKCNVIQMMSCLSIFKNGLKQTAWACALRLGPQAEGQRMQFFSKIIKKIDLPNEGRPKKNLGPQNVTFFT